jgi:hypothetical protein
MAFRILRRPSEGTGILPFAFLLDARGYGIVPSEFAFTETIAIEVTGG